MKPTVFLGANSQYQTNNKNKTIIPAYTHKSKEGQVVTYWKFSFWEKVKIIFGGGVWVVLHSKGQGFPPFRITTNKNLLFPPKPKTNGSEENLEGSETGSQKRK